MVSAAGLSHGSSPTRHLLVTLPGEGPVACQLFGSRPDDLAFAAREVTALHRFVALDLNAGCPVPKVTREGAGAALIKDPQLVHDLLAAMKRETDLPVTLKTRPGSRPDRVNMLELLDAAETAGASGITLHGRFTSQGHGGPVHLDLLAELCAKAKIPVTGNGGIIDAATAAAMAQTGVAALMIGRAALANPAIFAELKTSAPQSLLPRRSVSGALEEAELPFPSKARTLLEEHLQGLLELRAVLARDFPADHIPSVDGFVSVAMHTQLFRYFAGRPGAAEMRRRLNSIRTLAEIQTLVAAAFPGAS